MMLEEGLKAYLNSRSGLKSLIGDRVFHNRISQSSKQTTGKDTIPFPRILYRKLTGSPEYHIRGECGLARAVLWFQCQGKTLEDARGVAEELRLALSGFQGKMGSVGVRCSILRDETDEWIPDPHGDERGISAAERIYELTYVQAVPVFA